MGLFRKNRAFFLFLLKFGLSYLLLSVLYWLYLNQYDTAHFEADGITTLVSHQSKDVLLLMGKDVYIKPNPNEASYILYLNKKSVLRVVEGCNAVSVMILFAAFIVAFSTTFKRTSLYIIGGVIVIHLLNVIRIALLGLGFYYYPDYDRLLHDILFPVFIYGVVFCLWVLWVMKFSGNAKRKNNTK